MRGEKNKEFAAELTDEQLENAAGGYGVWDRDFFHQDQFKFSEEECDAIFEKYHMALTPGVQYTTGQLYKGLGCRKKSGEVQKKLNGLGFSKYNFKG